MEGTALVKVRGYHLDGYQHVNHARYLELMEEARWQLFDDHPEVFNHIMQQNLAVVVVNINIDYKSAAELGDTLRIHTYTMSTSGKSITLKQQVFRDMDNNVVTDATVTIVLVDRNTGESQLIDEEIKSLLQIT
jgi:thioesterase-3